MKTKLTTIAIAISTLLIPFFASGQEQQYLEPEPNNSYTFDMSPRNELSVSIGSVSLFGGIFDIFKIVAEGVGNGLANNQTNTRFIGTYDLEYYYQVNSWFRPGAKFIYEGLTTTIYDSTDALVNHYNTSTISVMASAQFSYLNRKHVKLYSGIDFGIAVIFDDNKQSSHLSTSLFAFNITPIGVRIGNDNIFGLIETNIGLDAIIKVGFGVRF